MSNHDNHDQNFDHNLNTFGNRQDALPGMSDALRARCEAAIRTGRANTSPRRFWRTSVLSGLGMAASIAILLVGFSIFSSGRRVEAATVLAKLDAQIAQDPLIELEFEAVTVDDFSIDGSIQIAADALYGDVVLVVGDGDRVHIDTSLALSGQGGWLLVRKLEVPDPQAMAFINFLFKPGFETLVLLPEDVAGEHGEIQIHIQEVMQEFASGELQAILEELRRSQEEFGATVKEQADGTLLFSLPITSEEVLERLKGLHEKFAEGVELEVGASGDDDGAKIEASIDRGEDSSRKRHDGVHVHVDSHELFVHESADGNDALIGSTIWLVYDPADERVRELSITDFGDEDGRVSIFLREGSIDPALLDSDPVRHEKTSVLDLDALIKMFDH